MIRFVDSESRDSHNRAGGSASGPTPVARRRATDIPGLLERKTPVRNRVSLPNFCIVLGESAASAPRRRPAAPWGLACAPLLAGLWLLTAAGVLAQDPADATVDAVDPVGRPTTSRPLQRWEFATAAEGWSAQNDCRIAVDDGALQIESTGDDPYLHVPGRWPAGRFLVRLRYRGQAAGGGALYWSGPGMPRSEERVTHFPLQHDGQWHECEARFATEGPLTDLRLDPGTASGRFVIDWIELQRERIHPLSIAALDVGPESVRYRIRNHTDRSVPCRTSHGPVEFPADSLTTIRRPLQKNSPLERIPLELAVEGFPPLKRTVFVHHPEVAGRSVPLAFSKGRLDVSADGTWARIFLEDRLVGTVAPLLLRQDRPVPCVLHEESPQQLVFAGEDGELSLTIAIDGAEVSFDVTSPTEVAGPIVRPLGGLEQGLLAGVEYLGRGERSSSTLDIETPEHVRFEPDPWHVTLPLMAVVTDRVAMGLAWESLPAQPLYACPNFIDGTDDHRMGLRGASIRATLRITAPVALEELILWSVRKWGLPEVPVAPRSPAAQRELSLSAYRGPLRNASGWGHCVEDRWPRRPYADIASSIWRLSGERPDLDSLVPGGGHIPNDAIYFVTGRARQWLERRRELVKGLLRRQEPDGAFRYRGEYARGHFEDTASGYCAGPAATLLEFARETGDAAALAAGLKTLDHMLRFRTPRGAQTWEVPLHTPDQLASARLVHAYVLGYELTGTPKYLAAARRWALTGIPFVYLWDQAPIMRYATPPVYGATNWKAPLWIGLPVQWVGAVYAYSLTELAPHDSTLDWRHLARGILHCGEQMQYPDGEYRGLFPDAFALRDQRRLPARINPATLISLRLRVDGELDSLSVAFDDTHHIVAPFPVTLLDGQARVESIPGVSYEVIVDGEHIHQLTGSGRDVLELP